MLAKSVLTTNSAIASASSRSLPAPPAVSSGSVLLTSLIPPAQPSVIPPTTGPERTKQRPKVSVVHLSASRERWEQAMARQLADVPQQSAPRWRSLVIMLVVMAGGVVVAQSVLIGEVAIALYGAYALVRRVPSVTTFKLVLVALVATVAAMLVHHTVSAANVFATYTFLLLVVGVLSLLRELPTESDPA